MGETPNEDIEMGNKISEFIDDKFPTKQGERDVTDHPRGSDEVDRPCSEDAPVENCIKPPNVGQMSDRPPVSMDDSEEMDEVDRPAPMRTNEKQNKIERQESEMLASILPIPEDKKPKYVDKNEEEEEMLATIDVEFDVDKFVLEKLPVLDELDEEESIEGVDGPPTGGDLNPTNETDGPAFKSLFRPNPQQEILVQHRSERKSREGIITKHTTYSPKPLDKGKTALTTGTQLYSDSYYKMDFFPRGRATIINVKYFKRSSGMADYPREGTNRDADGLTNVFLDLGFVVERFDNPSKKEIMAIVQAAAREDYTDKGCTICAILSHGEEGIVYGTDEAVQIKDITKAFRSRSLAGKPKFFLIQACQGSEYMDPVDKVDGPAMKKSLEKEEDHEMALALPSEADFLYAYSTVPGYYSWRNSRRGSWFMEALVKVFRENSHKMDVMRMLVQANNIVSSRKSRTDDYKTDNKRQIASIVNQMRKDFFFFPAYGPLPCD